MITDDDLLAHWLERKQEITRQGGWFGLASTNPNSYHIIIDDQIVTLMQKRNAPGTALTEMLSKTIKKTQYQKPLLSGQNSDSFEFIKF